MFITHRAFPPVVLADPGCGAHDERYYANSLSVDPKGPQSGSKHVVRGGSWHQTSTSWRSAFRREYESDYRGISIGFRLALSVDR
jgi:formylglycine-generating enzyme required for sulfatase activity